MPSTSTITYFVIVIGMTLYMIIAEWLGNIENIEWMKMFFDKTETHGMCLVEATKTAVANKYLTAGTLVGLGGAVIKASTVSFFVF